jgi:hypothetical protein
MSEKMVGLNLGERPLVTLPAGAFPERADAYVCDKCGRDITEHFRPPTSHSWEPMGPERYECLCGHEYLTGPREWNHLGYPEKRQRVKSTLMFGVLSSVIASIPSLLAYFFLRFAFGLREGALATSLIIIALPFVLIQIKFWPRVIASMWRTRMD